MYSGDPDGDAVPYNEFVSLARDEGLVALEVLVVQAPSEGNGYTAVAQATARTRDGGFSAVGEASPASAPVAWRPFLTTLAELRAKARALRDMTGLEHAVQEELDVPYQVTGDGQERERQPAPRVRPATTATPPTPAASIVRDEADEPDEPVDISSIPGLQRGMSGMKPVARPVQAPEPSQTPQAPATTTAPPAAPALSLSPRRDQDEDDERGPFDEDEDGGEQETETPAPRMIGAPAAPRALAETPAPRTLAERPAPSPAGEGPADYDDAVPPDMLDKLKRLAVSIAQLEGTELSDAQALLKLDDFFMRAFRRPLGKATRIEGQRVVQKLSSDLSKRRAAANAESDDD